MPYIGKDPQFIYTYTSGTATGNGSTTAFTISSGRTVEDVLVFVNGFQTGDGSDTTFTIDAGRAVNDVLVVVNGLTLVPTDDYTISGTTLTFASAPANLAEITVRYLRLS